MPADLWRVELQGAVDAGGHARQDHPSIALKTLSSSIDQGDDGAGV